MTFQKYNTRNKAFGRLLAGVNASATTLQLEAGQGERFANSNMILTLTQYTDAGNPTSEIVKEESIFVTNRSGDVFTITRGFGGDTPTSFNTGDWVYLSVRSEHIQDLQDEASRLENDKLNKGGLRTGLANAWRFFFSNGSNNEAGLAFGPSGRILQSNGANSIPTWEVPTTNITGLTTRANPNMNTDEFAVGGNPNQKVTLSQYRATTAEAKAGTSTTKFIAPAGLKEVVTDQIQSHTTFADNTTITATQNGFIYVACGASSNQIASAEVLVNGGSIGGLTSNGNNGRMIDRLTYPIKKGDTYRTEFTSSGGNPTEIRRFIPLG